ncbi:probable mitochondrial 2-oxoglutarate/malate carrier protein [Condylostylus longicornis]|uniref:probable mitochondrial 2-oxoglutarate/malate carrier protein n=1 Tax=Condylostylus longicornis TaxID=2530218 RepID=UPI00244DF7DC|nr:probable mitochondrial 2-oxoglutarate/malate carrier protein [Condylostylus longicornis]
MNNINENSSTIANFIIGGLAGTTTSTILYPIDFMKTRMSIEGSQNHYRSMYDCFKKIKRKEGFLTLYKGISALWLRQIIYSSTRIGIFITVEDIFKKRYHHETPNYSEHLFSAIIAGIGGSLASTPFEVILTRISIDGRLHKCERRNYKSIYDAFKKITKKEGYLTLWRGGCLSTESRLLTPDQKQQRIDDSEACLALFHRDKKNLRRYVTIWKKHRSAILLLSQIDSRLDWTPPGESRPKRPKIQPSAGKVMASVFWYSHGIFFIDYLEKEYTRLDGTPEAK